MRQRVISIIENIILEYCGLVRCVVTVEELNTEIEIILPTLEFINHTHFDCTVVACKIAAEDIIHTHSLKCNKEIYIYHQRINGINGKNFQVIVRHGLGEAVYIKSTGTVTIRYYFEDILLWLDLVHSYNKTGS